MPFTRQLMQMTRSGRAPYHPREIRMPRAVERIFTSQLEKFTRATPNERQNLLEWCCKFPLAWKPTIICYKNCWVILWFEMSGFLGLRDDFKSMWEERNSRRKHFPPFSLKLSSVEADVVTKEIPRATHPWEMAKATWDVGGRGKEGAYKFNVFICYARLKAPIKMFRWD